MRTQLTELGFAVPAFYDSNIFEREPELAKKVYIKPIPKGKVRAPFFRKFVKEKLGI